MKNTSAPYQWIRFAQNRIFQYCIVLFVVLITTGIVWLPFLLRFTHWFGLSIPQSDFLAIAKNYDGLLYIIPAKTGYNPELMQRIASLPPAYFAAHLPLYPFFIWLGSFVFGYVKSMIFVNVFFTVVLAIVFYAIVSRLKLSKHPLILTVVLLHLPRFLVVRSIGAPESLFLLLIISSLYFFEKENYFLAGLLGALSVWTKLPGILLFVAYSLVFVERYIRTKKIKFSYGWVKLIPVSLIALFGFYALVYTDFFAFFHTGGVVPMGLPFSQFNVNLKWIGTAWLEDILFYFALYGYTAIVLWKSKYRSFFYFAVVFFSATTLVQHRDIARYSLPMLPLTMIALEQFFTSKKFIILFIVLLPAIYLYAWNFISFNTMPVLDWSAYR
ncbi:hypothetical protein HGA88_00730 [Candidatus Roizmanbacteria bacterium]|nr:hypothetical protein [Candidatus Roizmanbacteria bacterium]